MKFRPLHDRVVLKRIEAEAEDLRWDHHPGHRQGKAPAGQRSLPWARAGATRLESSFPST